MQKIKIPEGCKASIDFEKRVVVIEREYPKFKSGDIVFASDHNNRNKTIFIYMKYEPDPNGLNGYHYYTQLNLITKNLYYTDSMSSDWVESRIATPSEAQLLFDALAKEGKRWNAETMQIEDIEKDILVPESVGIYRCREDFGDDGDGLYIAFNNNTQLLYYNSKYKVWYTIPLHSWYKKVQCKLTPCKREDLKAGDTVSIGEYKDAIDNYYKFLGDGLKLARPTNARGVWIESITPDVSKIYKVEPLSK